MHPMVSKTPDSKRTWLFGELPAAALVTSRAAIAAAKARGKSDKHAADLYAVEAMREALNELPIRGTIVIGEGERDEAPMLFIGERVGLGDANSPEIDIALDPLEGTTLAALDMPDSLCVVAFSPKGGLLAAPDVYMDKIAVGANLPLGVISLDRSPTENIYELAKAKNKSPDKLIVCVLDRPRHDDLVDEINATGARVKRIKDGDVAAVVHTSLPGRNSIDMYIGRGAAPEGVLAAAALRCIGGQMEGRLVLDSEDKLRRATQMMQSQNVASDDPSRILRIDDMVRDHVTFVATGVTDGTLLHGVTHQNNRVETNTLLLDSLSGGIHRFNTSIPV